MSHMVIYRGADGKPGYHQTDEIHDAVGFVEQMRNQEGVEHARIFRLEEVVFEYRPYYRVELAGGASAGPALSALNGVESDGLKIAARSGSPVAEATTTGPVANGISSGQPANGQSQPLNAVQGAAAESESIELPDDVIEVIDGLDDSAEAENPLGKSLFGR